MTIHTTCTDADRRAEAIAMDLERAASGGDTLFHAARAFGSFHFNGHHERISEQSASRILQAIDRVRPIILTFASSSDEAVFTLAALEGARRATVYWSRTEVPFGSDRTVSVSADLVRWLARSCVAGCNHLAADVPPSMLEAKLSVISAQATPRKARK